MRKRASNQIGVRPMADRAITIKHLPMVRAILAGTKTQHRTVLLRPTDHFHQSYTTPSVLNGAVVWTGPDPRMTRQARGSYAVGDRLWVREAIEAYNLDLGGALGLSEPIKSLDLSRRDISPRYRVDQEPCVNEDGFDYVWSWKKTALPADRMPRAFSRVTLVVTDVRVMRLAEISKDDALAEGVNPSDQNWAASTVYADNMPAHLYGMLWEHINGPGSWALNPWVTATTFVPRLCNIDKLEPSHV